MDGDGRITASLRGPNDASSIRGAAREHAAVAALDLDCGLVTVCRLLATILDALQRHRKEGKLFRDVWWYSMPIVEQYLHMAVYLSKSPVFYVNVFGDSNTWAHHL